MSLFTRYVVLFILLTTVSFSAKGVTANFTASSVVGCAPLVVHFTNTSTPMAGTTFDWDLGNGTGIIHLTNPSGSYLTPGTYTVRLTAYNGGSSSTKTMTITVKPAPVVSFTTSDSTICPNTTVTFVNTSIPNAPGAMTCTWNFGDGFTGAGSPVNHTYTATGFYNVTLSVTNSDGCVSSLTKPAHIQVYALPAPYFSAAVTHFCEAPGNAVFTNLTSGTGPFSYIWRFGDGGTSTTTSPTHTYGAVGSYPVTLVVTDGNGCRDSATIPSFITVGNLSASFTAPATACINTLVTFTNTSSPHTSRTWDYGGAGASYGVGGSFTFTTAGVYPIRLIIFDGFCYDTVIHSITILPGPTASFAISPTDPCPPPTAITFTGTAPAGTVVSWLYGDGTSGSGMTSTHTYWRRGIYDIKMIVVDGVTGCRDTVERKDTLYDMVHWITATPTSGCRPLTVNFTSHMMTWMTDTMSMHPYPYPTTSYSWTFGDGGTSSSPTPSHTYTDVGVYTVVLTRVTSNGCTVYDTTRIHVGKPPVVTLTATPTHLCYNRNVVYFYPTIVVGPADTFQWAFGDGGAATTGPTATSYTYTRPGFFTATLTPYYNGCPGAPVTFGIITIDSPKAIIRDSVYCSPARRVKFYDSSMGCDTHIWTFGDGATSTLDHPIHDYPAATVYTVTLTTYNIRSGCRDTARTILDLRRPIVSFSTTDTTICRDSLVYFTSTVTGGSASAYYWHSSGRSADSNAATYLDTFHTTGYHTITLIIADQNGCFDTAVRPNYILVSKPDAAFTITPPNGCAPLTTVFTDASTGVPGTFRTGFAWEFGDGTSGFTTVPSVSHTFVAAGVYTSTLTVTDNIGCKDTVISTSATVWQPTAAFSATDVTPCRTDSIRFNNLSSSDVVSSFWMFGDGGTSTLASPWHRYGAPGSYTVSLIVTDSHGCTDTATYINYIQVIQPIASFYMDDSVSICPPLFVKFFNTSVGGLFYNWDLGGGVTSTIPFPTNLYTSPGLDTIRLIVSNVHGCRDTAYGHVNIFGYDGAFTYNPKTGCVPLTVNFYAMTLNVPSIIWDFADGITSAVSFTDTISHTYLLPGAYVPKLILDDGSGCQNSSLGLDTIKVNEVYPAFRVIPNPVCIGDTFMVVDSSHSYWSTVTGLSWSVNGQTATVDSSSFFINATGTYPVTFVATDGWGCTGTLVKDVTIHPLPDINASPDTVICVGDAATLKATGGTYYKWSPAATLHCATCNPAYATPSVVTTYTVMGTDMNGCKSMDTVAVALRTHTESIARGDTEVCYGIPVPLFDSGGTKYRWLPPVGLSDPNIANPMATPSWSTKYMAIAQLAGCIPDTNYVTVIVHPLPEVNAGPDQTLLAGSDAQINTTGKHIYKYMWTNAESLSCDTCANPLATMSVTTTYIVTVSTDFGCLASDSITIHLYCDESQLFIPNSFTPNNDGQNDVFYPRGNGVSIIRSFRIYNRWGELLFERSGININDESNAWDGSFKGGTPRPDVYVYVINALCETGEPINVKGDVTIIR